jgi:hypothetical protein
VSGLDSANRYAGQELAVEHASARLLAPHLLSNSVPRDTRVALEISMKLRTALFTLVCSAGLAGVAHAQQKEGEVPKDYRPPRDVPDLAQRRAGQAAARADGLSDGGPQPPSNGKVVFGDDYKGGKHDGDSGEKRMAPFIRKFGEDRKKP